jgi:anti-sigma28 factor (negative regulator of flagellin synthesis)
LDAAKDTFSIDAANAAQKPMSTATGDAASNDDTETEVESQQVKKHDGLTESVIQEMKVADLKEQLRKRRCRVSGKKDELVARL